MTEAFVYDAIRTPFGKFGKGLAGVRPDDLAAHIVRCVVGRAPGLTPDALEAGALDGGTDDALPPGEHPATATITATPNATPTRRTRDRDPNQPIMDILETPTAHPAATIPATNSSVNFANSATDT